MGDPRDWRTQLKGSTSDKQDRQSRGKDLSKTEREYTKRYGYGGPGIGGPGIGSSKSQMDAFDQKHGIGKYGK